MQQKGLSQKTKNSINPSILPRIKGRENHKLYQQKLESLHTQNGRYNLGISKNILNPQLC